MSKKKLTSRKARKMLRHGRVRGKSFTRKQKRMLHARAGRVRRV